MNTPTHSMPEEFFHEEIRAGYKVTSDIKKLWAIELDMLAKLDEVCQKHGLKYFAAGGTLLGAIRHRGFIPWDDDIDVGMLREDYEKLMKLGDEFKAPYFLQTYKSDQGYFRMQAKIRNSETTAATAEKYQETEACNRGIFLDIFPYDYISNNERIRKRQLFIIRLARNVLAIKQKGKSAGSGIRVRIKNFIYFCLRNVDIVELTKRTEKHYIRENGTHVTWLVSNARENDEKVQRCIFPAEYFTNIRRTQFENFMINIPEEAEKILIGQYGEDYMTPKSGTAMHEMLYFNAEVPYASND